MKLYKVTITGTTPLLMNRFTGGAEIAVSNGYSPSFSGGDKGTPREQAEVTAYRDTTTGELFIPGPNIFSCIIAAGIFFKLNKSKITTQKSSLIPAGVLVLDIVCPLGTKDFEVDSRSIVNPKTGGRMMKHRARLDKWSLTFTLEVDDGMFGENLIRSIIDAAGTKIGLGDYRPARKGPFGRFKVTNWVVEE